MSEQEFQPELNDELLSAYLDDELSAEERAAVEARLANDADAQQLLHQLRAVSESVQRLPLEGVGRDLSGDILRRVAAAKSGEDVAAADAATPVRNVSEIRIFGSRRSWFWASLAVAAGLMIMVLHLGDEKGRKLGSIAERARNGSVGRELEVQKVAPDTVANAPLPDPSAGDSTKTAKLEAPAPSAAPSGQMVGDGRAAGAPSATAFGGGAPSSTSSSGVSVDQPHDNLQHEESQLAAGNAARAPTNLTLDVGGGPKADAGKIAEALPPSSPRPMVANRSAAAAVPPAASGDFAAAKEAKPTESLVVIRVVAKPEAFRSGAFDKTLADHQVEFEASEEGEKFVDEVRQKVVNAGSDAQVVAEKDGRADRVIVEAPEETVAACLAAIERDKANFVSVKIGEPTEAGLKVVDNEVTKQLGAELAQSDQRDWPTKEKNQSQDRFYASDEVNKDALRNKPELGRESAARKPTAPEPSGERLRRVTSRGRALRLLSEDSDKNEPNEAKPRGGGIGGGGVATRRVRADAGFDLKKSTSGRADDVRVLFIVSPEVEPAAAPVDKPTK
jgi:negative regulator of sigma E activity